MRLISSILCSLFIIMGLSFGAWESSLISNFSLNQAGFSNWSAGGENSWSWQTDILAELLDKGPHSIWKQNLKVSYGLTQQGNADARKSADEFNYETVYTVTDLHLYASFQTLTQLTDGKNYTIIPAPTISKFFDPAYFTESIGYSWNISKSLNARAGVALKQTVVNQSSITSSKSSGGGELVISYEDQLQEGQILVSAKLGLFSDLQGLDTTDINGDLLLKGKIAANLNWMFSVNTVYDKDVSTEVQVKQTSGLQIQFDLI